MNAYPWIAYVGPVAFPEGDAGTRRVLGMAQTLAALGYRVNVLAGLNAAAPESPISGERITCAGMGEYDRSWPGIRKLVWTLTGIGQQTLQWLESLRELPAAVFVYGSPTPLLYRLLPWGRRHAVPIVCDIVEWYAGRQLTGGVAGPIYWSCQYALRYQVPRTSGVIGISRLLCDYYHQQGCPVIRIPPTLDTEAALFRSHRQPDSRIQLVYAGVPGKKDLLGNVLRALGQVDPLGERLKLRIVGPTEPVVRSLFPGYPEKAVEVTGRCTHAQTLQTVRDSDFSVLLRPNARYANAGFPTKVVESLACGTPVICNLTSDLAEHIRDRETGLVCADCSVDACAKALDAARSFSNDDLVLMRRNARARAVEAFDSGAYADALRRFLAEVGVRQVPTAVALV